MTVAVLAILVALATPSFQQFTRNNRVTAVNNDLITALNMTRSEAARRSVPVTVCASVDGATCATAADWASGWIVFQNAGAAGVVAQQSDIVQKWGSAPGGMVRFATDSAYIQYQPTGTTDVAATIDVSYQGCQGMHMRHVQVSLVGMISTQLQQCP